MPVAGLQFMAGPASAHLPPGSWRALYRSILRFHKRALPPHLIELGDSYVRSEWRQHRGAKPEFLQGFYQEWSAYLLQLQAQAKTRQWGVHMKEKEAGRLSAEQMEQLRQLRESSEASFREDPAGSREG